MRRRSADTVKVTQRMARTSQSDGPSVSQAARLWAPRVRLRAVLCLALFLLLGQPWSVGAQTIEVTPLARDGQVLVSFGVKDAYDEGVEQAIQSGLQTVFTYDVDLRRAASVWLDRTISTARVVATVKFDNLTRRYQVTVVQDGRVDQSHVTDDLAAVRQWTTEFARLPLFNTRMLEPNAEYYIRVRAQLKPRSSMLAALPWGRAAALGSAKFTFLP